MLQQGVHIWESHHHFRYAHPLISYDKVGNRTTKADNSGTANYTYDTLNRLVQATNPIPTNPLETFNYDAVGNRIDSNQNGASNFNDGNQLTEDANFTYQYDANGNLIQKTDKATLESTVFEYDAENKLIRVASLDKTVNYKYDGLGRRIEKEVTETGVTTVIRYVYDNEDILLELDGSNNITARYTHGPGIDEPLIMEKGGQSFFYHADDLGSITELTDTAGTVIQSYAYSSFGKIESQVDPSFVQPYTFTARELDAETGLYHYRARAYDPSIGRFLQEDPIGFAGGDLNLYPYVANNPVNSVDPDGEFVLQASAIVVFVGVTVVTGKAILDSLFKIAKPGIEKREEGLRRVSEGIPGGEQMVQEGQEQFARGAELAGAFCELGTPAIDSNPNPTPIVNGTLKALGVAE